MLDIRDHGGNFGGSKRSFKLEEFGFPSLPGSRIIYSPSQDFSEAVYDKESDAYFVISLISGTYYLRKIVKNSQGRFTVSSSVSLSSHGTIALVGRYTPYVYMIINNYPDVYRKSDLTLVTDENIIPGSFRGTYTSPVIAESSSRKVYLITMNGSYISATIKEYAVNESGVMTFIADRTFGMAGSGATALLGFVHEDIIYLSTTNINNQRQFGMWNMKTNTGTVSNGTATTHPSFNGKTGFVENGYLYVLYNYTIIKYLINANGSITLVSSKTFFTPATGDSLIHIIFNFGKFIGIAVNISVGNYIQMFHVKKDTLDASAPSNQIFYDTPYGKNHSENAFLARVANGISENFVSLVRK